MKEELLRALLSSGTISSENVFDILSEISSMVNDFSRHDLGREMVIRTLAVQKKIPSEYNGILQDLVRAVGLLPYSKLDNDSSFEDYILAEAHRVHGLPDDTFFHTLQLQIFNLIMSGQNVVLSATTSVGKSLVIDAVAASNKFKKLAIIVPTIALIDETRRRLLDKFGNSYAIITHPSQSTEGLKSIIYVLTQERALARKDLTEVEFFVIDEFYKLDVRKEDDHRAIDLNLCFHRLASNGAKFYLIGPHISEIRGLANQYDYRFIPSHFSTVALDIVNYNIKRDSPERSAKLVQLCKQLTSPTLIYCQSPAKAAEVALQLILNKDFKIAKNTTTVVDWLEEEYPKDWIVTRSLKYGIGIHHGNIPRYLQQFMVKAFERKEIKFLICTSTLIEGVNTVAENVIVYDRRIKTSNLDYFTFRNIAGRAGRMGRYFIGKVFVLEEYPEQEDKAVDLPIGQQDEKSPMSLLLDLKEEDLTEVSKNRLFEVFNRGLLSPDTLRRNRQIPIDDQYSLAYAILNDPEYLENLSWRGMPNIAQLKSVCDLIFKYLDKGNSLSGYDIYNGDQLSARLNNLRFSKRFRDFIEDRVKHKRDNETVSEAVEKSLKFVRKYLSYSFPRHLMAIESIFNDVMSSQKQKRIADYKFYAAMVENVFLDSGVFALEEYGIPHETSRKLMENKSGLDTLDAALLFIANMDTNGISLHSFERKLLEELQTSTRSYFPLTKQGVHILPLNRSSNSVENKID